MEAITAAPRSLAPADSGIKGAFDFPALGYALLPLLLAVRYLNAPPDTRTYGPSHWFLDYRHGFLRRALIGDILSHVGYISWHTVFVIEAMVFACVVALTYLIFRKVLFGNLDERRFGAFLLAAPAFLPHMGSMAGELDNFLYIVLLSACCCLLRLANNTGLVLATLSIGVGLVIHEGFLLMFYPLLFILTLHLWHQRRISTLAVCLHGFAVALCFFAIVVGGRFHGTVAEWVTSAQQRTDMPIEAAVLLPLNNTVSQQIAFVRHCYTGAFVSRIALTLLLSIPYGIALWRLLMTTVRRQRYAASLNRLILVTFFIPLCLIPLGHDIMRWLAALCINMSLYILFLYQQNESQAYRCGETTTALLQWAGSTATAAIFLYLVVLGPWVLSGTHMLSNIGSVFGKPAH